LASLDLLDDEEFSRYWVEQRETFKPRSRFALSQELRQKGITNAVIEKVLSGLDEEVSARRAVAKQARRWEHLPRDLFRRKVSGYLSRRGFDYEIINLITDELWRTIAESATSDDATLKET
jgi:regulatory protein